MASARYQRLNDMRGLDDSTDVLIRVSQTATEQVRHGWRAFVNFAARDNVLEVALGLIIANAFTKVVTSFVSDMALPIVSLLPFLNRNMDQKFAVLSQGPNYVDGEGYNTIEQARDDGALVLAWGMFVENILNFAGVSLTLFAVAHLYMFISHDKIIKPTIRCRYCRKFISVEAKRCANCSSWQDGREDLPQKSCSSSSSSSNIADRS
ncbi:Large-conductance mechanosensitive channel [Penicillium daleae]|uniref:Large-conductance mechanosensitive channel n=1 Tax=Penicillium daleae TaxID=63821 RepID=A0AAD6FXF1_9EURO|nr:Large-conductance mechanosensitive channel [Penicillium daleae]KAJ5432947.1 Large-conductance mechanosensitive channel [Penicillium daleae]